MDTDVSRYDATARRLTAWGLECRGNSESLGLPTISGIARLIEHVRVQERLRVKLKKRLALRKARQAWQQGGPPLDPKLIAEDLGFARPPLTARGKQTASFLRPAIQFHGSVAEVDQAVSTLPGWAKVVIRRCYLYGQPPKRAALQLRMPVVDYLQRLRAAVFLVADKLEDRCYTTGA